MTIELPISKSIANRLLILQYLHGDELMPVSAAMPEDVRRLHDVLLEQHWFHGETIDLDNAGTPFRFLTALLSTIDGTDAVLTGCERMCHRPIGQLVDCLTVLGASIDYLGENGFPPIHICGKQISPKLLQITNPLSTQFVSALMLVGCDVHTNSKSPYISMTQQIISSYPDVMMERDWSAAAFWYEYIAIHGGEIILPGLPLSSIQGDKAVSGLFASLGVETTEIADGVCIRKISDPSASTLKVDFLPIPDLYPAMAITCENLHVDLHAVGTDALQLKESDRLEAVASHRVMADHRMAMALLAADYVINDTSCIRKSYPLFMEQLCALKR